MKRIYNAVVGITIVVPRPANFIEFGGTLNNAKRKFRARALVVLAVAAALLMPDRPGNSCGTDKAVCSIWVDGA